MPLMGCPNLLFCNAAEIRHTTGLLHFPYNASIRDGNGRNALHFAATGGSAEVVGAIFDMAPTVINSKVMCLFTIVTYLQ